MKNRQSHRLNGYNYSLNGAYFITIVCQDRIDRFGEIVEGEMVLSDAGKMVKSVWEDFPDRFPMMKLDAFVVMPNHFHGIVIIKTVEPSNTGEHKVHPDGIINHRRGEPCVHPGNDNDPNIPNHPNTKKSNNKNEYIHPTGTSSNSIGRIIQAFKSITTNRYIKGVKMDLIPPFRKRLWQRDYWDRIIRNSTEAQSIREYIINNPKKWEMDRFGSDGNSVREDSVEYGDDWRIIC